VRFESFGHAFDHPRVAAATLAGVPAPYDAVPWFWSDQGTLKLQIAGLSAGYDQAVLRGDRYQERFSVLYYASDKLIAVDAINTVNHGFLRYVAKRGGIAEVFKRFLESEDDDIAFKATMLMAAYGFGKPKETHEVTGADGAMLNLKLEIVKPNAD